MPLNKTCFRYYYKQKKTLSPIRVDRIEFNVFLYIAGNNQCHIHFATFFNKEELVVQYSEKYIAFSDFMDALFQYSAEDEISVELEEWETQNNSGYKEKQYRERVWEYIQDNAEFKERISDIAHQQVESWREQSGTIKGHAGYIEDWYSYYNSVFNIEKTDAELDDFAFQNKNGQSELEKNWN